MYAFVDQPVDSLGDGSRFVLWAMRGWIQTLALRRCPPAALAPAFAKMGVLPALPDLHKAMILLNRDGLGKLALAPTEADRIGEDEAVLLGIWRDLVMDENDRVRATLALLVEDEAIAPLVDAMVDTAANLSVFGLAPVGLKTRTTDRAAGRAT